MNVWTAEQLGAFVQHVRDDRLAAASVVLATTGMRRGELLGLRWAGVDLDRRSLSVRHTRTVVDSKVVAGTPKTERGTRTVSLDPSTVAALRAHRSRQRKERLLCGPTWIDTGLIFTQPDGTEIHPQRLSAWF